MTAKNKNRNGQTPKESDEIQGAVKIRTDVFRSALEKYAKQTSAGELEELFTELLNVVPESAIKNFALEQFEPEQLFPYEATSCTKRLRFFMAQRVWKNHFEHKRLRRESLQESEALGDA